MSFIGVAAGIGAGTGLIKIGMGLHQNHLANKIKVPDATYVSSPYAAKMLAEATRLKNSRMPGATDAINGIYGSGANAMGSVDRNATSSAQALSMLGAIQGNTDSAFNNLSQQQNNYQLNAENSYNNALNTEIGEGDKVYQSDLQKRQDAINQKNALRGAGTQNIGGGLNDIQNNAFAYAAFRNGQMNNNPGIGSTPYNYYNQIPNYPTPSMYSSTEYINPQRTP